MTETILDGTGTTSPAFTFDRWGRVTVFVSGASAAVTVAIEARPADEPGAPWVPAQGGVWQQDQVRHLRAGPGLEYRARAAAAGPVVRITTELGVTTA